MHNQAAIAGNQLRTLYLMLVIFGLIALVSWAFGYLIAGQSSPLVIGGALIFAAIMALATWYNSDKMVLRMAHAQPLTEAQIPWLFDLIRDIAHKAGIPMPAPYLIEDSALNAFATGRSPEHAAIALTTGILQALDREALAGVIAHELSHVRNRDTLVMTIATVVASAIGMLGGFTRFGLFTGMGGRRRSNDSNPVMLILALVMLLIAPILAALIQLAISRQREYLADASGATITGKPEDLARALAAISGHSTLEHGTHPAVAPLMIANPFAGLNVRELFSTHPPIEDRIRRLRSFATSR